MKFKWITSFILFGLTSYTVVASSLPVDLEGNSIDPLHPSDSKAVVLLFFASDCPISNRYAPLVNRIVKQYGARGVQFYSIYPMSSETADGILAHQKDFGYELTALMDPDHYLVDKTNAMVTPEAAVYLPSDSGDGQWIYHGRINDLYVDFGKWRRNPTSNDLTDTLDALLAGQIPELRRTRAIGCYIEE